MELWKSYRLKLLALLVLVFMAGTGSFAQQSNPVNKQEDNFDIRKASFLLPQNLPPWRYTNTLSICYVVLPPDWTLDAINVPMISYSGKYTLPYGFNFQGSLTTLFVSNRLNFGPFWNYSHDHYHFGIGYQFAFMFGYLGEFGYKTAISGWEQQPSIVFGYSFRKSAITVRGDLYYTSSLHLDQGGHLISVAQSFLNGYGVTISYEQRLYKNKVMSFGVNLANLRYHFLAWPAFPVNHYRYFVPSFQLGINLSKYRP